MTKYEFKRSTEGEDNIASIFSTITLLFGLGSGFRAKLPCKPSLEDALWKLWVIQFAFAKRPWVFQPECISQYCAERARFVRSELLLLRFALRTDRGVQQAICNGVCEGSVASSHALVDVTEV